MFSVDAFLRINRVLGGVFRMAYLNLLWLAATALGLIVFGIGPASYAVAAYVDRWFRLGDTPPVTRAFLGHLKAQFWRAAVMGWILLAASAIAVTNLFSVTVWALQFANVAALIVITIIAAYVFPVMAATDVTGPHRQIAAALMIGVGSLHWTIVAGGAVALTWWLLANYATPLLPLIGIGVPAAAFGFVTRIVFAQLAHDAQDAAPTSPLRRREPAPSRTHVARGTTQ